MRKEIVKRKFGKIYILMIVGMFLLIAFASATVSGDGDADWYDQNNVGSPPMAIADHIYTFGSVAITETDEENPSSIAASKLVIYDDNGGIANVRFVDEITETDSEDGFIVGIDSDDHGTIWNFEEYDINFATNDVERMRIVSDGKVGIGTSTPDRKLDIEEASEFSQLRLTYTSETKYTDFQTTTDGYLAIINSHNRVGIGTNTPGSLLAIYGATPIVDIETSDSTVIDGEPLGTIQFRGLDATEEHLVGAMIRAEAADTWDGDDEDNAPTELQFFTEDNTNTDHLATPRMVITNDGKVGIGLIVPQEMLHIHDSTSRIRLTNPTTGYDANNGFEIGLSNSAKAAYIDNRENAAIAFQTQSTTRLLISGTGLVGIGNSFTPNAILEVADSTDNVDLVKFKATSTTQNSDIVWIGCPKLKSEGTGYNLLKIDHDTGYLKNALTVRGDGRTGIAETSPVTTLDVNGGFATHIYKPLAYDYTIDSGSAVDYTLICEVGDGEEIYDIDLPDANTCIGRIIIIKKISGSNTLQIDAAVGDTIEGAGTYTVATGKSYMIQSYDASKWYIIAEI